MRRGVGVEGGREGGMRRMDEREKESNKEVEREGGKQEEDNFKVGDNVRPTHTATLYSCMTLTYPAATRFAGHFLPITSFFIRALPSS